MAELILNSRGPHKGPGAESYYDFDPANKAMLEAIETFLARRSGVPGMQEKFLADLCEKSIGNDAADIRRATLFGWMEILRNLFRNVRSGNSDNRRRGSRRGRKPGNGFSSAGDRRRLSFA